MSIELEAFVIDPEGRRTAVLIDIVRYRELLEAEEELDCIRAYDDAKSSGDETIPLDQAVGEIEAERN